MKIAICDDDALCRTQILNIVKEYIAQKQLGISVSVYSRSAELLEDIQRMGGFDIYLLDILMPGMNGIQLGIELRQLGFHGSILYLTSSQEYAIDAFKAYANGYILKPVRKEELLNALDTVVMYAATRTEKGLIVKTKENSIRLSFDSILYAQLERKAVVYHLLGDKLIEGTAIRSSFSEAVQELLRDPRFVLCGVSIIVNLHYITAVENEAIVFHGGSKLYIGKRACRELRSAWSDFWFNGGNQP